MSFSKEIKEELSKLNNLNKKSEVLCEFLGYLTSNNVSIEDTVVKYSTESDYNIDRFAKVIRNIGIEDFDINFNGKIFSIIINKIYINNIKEFNFYTEKINNIKSFVRGLYMGAGSMNDPKKKYHLECQVRTLEDTEKIMQMMTKNGINIKQRKNVIYIKEGEEISKFLAFIGAVKSVLNFEEIRVQRHMNNKVNRIVNCESANLNKVLNASIEQINAIKKLKENGKFEKLDKNLKEIAILRLENPDMSLVELGKMLENPVGKSGVNYRLKKIIQLSKEI